MLDGMELLQFPVIELHTHLVDLFHADTVFTGDGASRLNTELENPATQFLGSFELALDVGIIKYQWMQVTIAGMKNINDGQTVSV